MVAQEPEFKYAVGFWKLLFFCMCSSLTLCLHSDGKKVLKTQRVHKDVFRINEGKGSFGCWKTGLRQVGEGENLEHESAGGYQLLK